MLSENIKAMRRAKGLSQQELAVRLNVVRQTVSKWEQNLSVPDSDMLLALSEALETPVSRLLGESVAEPEADELKAIAAKLEVINLQLARRRDAGRRARTGCSSRCARARLQFSRPCGRWEALTWTGTLPTPRPLCWQRRSTGLNGCSSGRRQSSSLPRAAGRI